MESGDPNQPGSGNAHPNQIGQPDGGDRKRRRRNAIYPTSEAAAVIVQARTTFFLNAIHSGVDDMALSTNSSGGTVDEADTAERTPVPTTHTRDGPQPEARRSRRRGREQSTDDIIEGPRDAGSEQGMLVPSHLLGWSSDSGEDVEGSAGDDQ